MYQKEERKGSIVLLQLQERELIIDLNLGKGIGNLIENPLLQQTLLFSQVFMKIKITEMYSANIRLCEITQKLMVVVLQVYIEVWRTQKAK